MVNPSKRAPLDKFLRCCLAQLAPPYMVAQRKTPDTKCIEQQEIFEVGKELDARDNNRVGVNLA
jgi:hypothetical protein